MSARENSAIRLARRRFLEFVAASPLIAGAGPWLKAQLPENLSSALNLFDFEGAAREKLDRATYDFVADGADDRKTLEANRNVFDGVKIRARRLVDVSRIDTRIQLLGENLASPVLLAPIGSQRHMHPEGELAVARAAQRRGHRFIVSTLSSFALAEIASAGEVPWFQLYPTTSRQITVSLMRRAEAAGCSIMALTVDTPVVGNRESQRAFLDRLLSSGGDQLGNFEGLTAEHEKIDPSLDWDFVDWLRERTSMKLLLKGIVTSTDAELCLQHQVDGIIVSNHGGRQEESNRSTLESLPEVLEAAASRIPVLIDGGFRRGTDVFKALALGATAVCIGRPYIWGLAAFGEAGVDRVLEIIQAELIRIMQLAGTVDVSRITDAYVEQVPGRLR